MFYNLPEAKDKNYNNQEDIKFIGKYFYKMCFPEKNQNKNEWISDIQVKEKETKYSSELMNIIYLMSMNVDEKNNALQIYNKAKDEYVKKFSKITSIDSVLRCLYSFSDFNASIYNKEQTIKNN